MDDARLRRASRCPVATGLLVDRGHEAQEAVAGAADVLTARLAGTVVVPSFRTPLERELSASTG